MEIEIYRKEFLVSLLFGGSCAGKSRVLPILNCVKLKFGHGSVIISSYDEEVSVMRRVRIKSVFSDIIEFCIDAKDLTGILRSLTDDELTFVYDESSLFLNIRHSRGVIELPVFVSSEYPRVDSTGSGVSFSVDSSVLHDWVRNSGNFVLDDQFKPQLSGMYLYCSGNVCGVCASDGMRMFVDSVSCDYELPTCEAIVSVHCFSSLCQLLSSNGGDVTVLIDERNVTFKFSDSLLSCRLLEGRYPNFRAILPNESTVNVIVDKKELRNTVVRSNMFTEANSCVSMNVAENKAVFSAENVEFSKKTTETLAVSCEGGGIIIGFNGHFLLDCLNAIDSDTVSIDMISPRHAISFKDSENVNRRVLLFPIAL